MSKVIVRKTIATNYQSELDYPIYLNFQNEDCLDELVKVDEKYRITVKHNHFGFEIDYSTMNTIFEHDLCSLTTKEHFEQFLDEAIKILNK